MAQADNVRILWQNLVDPAVAATTLSASSQVATLPVDNLKDYRPAIVWRTTGVAAEYVTADLGSIQAVSDILAWNHNWTVQARIRVRLYDDAGDLSPIVPTQSGSSGGTVAIANGTYDVFIASASGSEWITVVVSGGTMTIAPIGSDPAVTAWAAFVQGALTSAQMIRYAATGSTASIVYDSGLIDGWTAVSGLGDGSLGGDFTSGLGGYPNLSAFAAFRAFRAIQLPTTYQARYVRLDIQDPTNPAGYLDMGRLFIGTGYQPSLNPVYGLSLEWTHLSKTVRTDAGGLRRIVRPSYRKLTMNWDYLPQDEALTQWDDIHRIIGISRDIFVLVLPTGTTSEQYRTAIYGIPSDNGKLSTPVFQRWSTQMVLEELI